MPDECLFCGIAAGRVDATVVLEEHDVVAFLDVRPVFKGHVLIVPRVHVDTLLELPDQLVEPLFVSARRVARAVPDAFAAQGTFVAMNNVVSQSVPHLHVHVVPRTKGDGLRGFFWPRTNYDSDDEREAYGLRLRGILAETE